MSDIKQFSLETGGNVTYYDGTYPSNDEQTTDELICKLTKQVAELTTELNQVKEAYDDNLQDQKWTYEDVERLTTEVAELTAERDELIADDKKQMEEIRELRGLRNIFTARAEQAEADLNKIIVVAKKRRKLIAEVQQRSKDYEKYQIGQMSVDLYDLKNADKELNNVVYDLVDKALAGDGEAEK